MVTAVGVGSALAATAALLPSPAATGSVGTELRPSGVSVLGSSAGVKYAVTAPQQRKTGVAGPSLPLTIVSMPIESGRYWLAYTVSIRPSPDAHQQVSCQIIDAEARRPIRLPDASSLPVAHDFTLWRQGGNAALPTTTLALTCSSKGSWLGTLDLREISLEAVRQF